MELADPKLSSQLESIAASCQALSDDMRAALGPDRALQHLQEVLTFARGFFSERTLEILVALDQFRVLRYGQLKSRLFCMSTRTLAARLMQLQERGLVDRQMFGEIPPRVEYRLTDLGRQVMRSMFPTLIVLGNTSGQARGQ